MDSWWDDIDEELLTILRSTGPMDPADLAMKLGMSPAAVCSCLGLLSTSGRVRIRLVEATAPGVANRAA
jgi:DNA-binding Lrp family transcriptional regulator